MLKANASHMKALHLRDLRSAFKKVDWRSLRDVDFRGAKHALRRDLKDVDPSTAFAAGAGVFEGMTHVRRDCDAERRKSAMFAAVGAATAGAVAMYFFDPRLGESRRSAARERLEHWYLGSRGQLDRGWRRLQSESPSFHLTEKGGSGADPLDAPRGTPPEEAAALAH